MRRAARALIDHQALRHNLIRVRSLAPNSRVMAVIKADAYGHDMRIVAQALEQADGFAVTSVAEALYLRDAGIRHTLLVLQGFASAEELLVVAEHGMSAVVHEPTQLKLLENTSVKKPIDVWLKIDTGMHRLGFAPAHAERVYQQLCASSKVRNTPTLMTHLAYADDRADSRTRLQLAQFDKIVAKLGGECSIANSAGVLCLPETHRQWVRPGIMLYGSSPFVDGVAEHDGIKPAMVLQAPLIAVKWCQRGDAVGYGGSYTCPEDMPIGVAAIGYGDGYPRHATNGTPVLVRGERAQLVGRVSMDMITIDLRNVEAPKVGDQVVAWGQSLSVDEVARHAGTISYELLCTAGHCVARELLDLADGVSPSIELISVPVK